MAFFTKDEALTEEPFIKLVNPLGVASPIQSALEATWENLPQSERNIEAVRLSILAEFKRVEAWWMGLSDRRAHRIWQESEAAFGMPRELADAAKREALTLEQIYKWAPANQLAHAIFHAWLLQPEDIRDPARTITLVRKIIHRQLVNLADDIAAFG